MEYRPSVVFVRTSLSSVPTATTEGKYYTVRPSHLVSKYISVLDIEEKNNTQTIDLHMQIKTDVIL